MNFGEADDALALPDLDAIRAAARAHRAARAPNARVHAVARSTRRSGRGFISSARTSRRSARSRRAARATRSFSLAGEVARRGVVTHSSGNHGAALAYAAARRGIPAWVVMPDNAPWVKQDNVRRFGATIRLCAPNVAAREATCADVQRETGAVLVHPFDDARVIAGQGTAALEVLEDLPKLDVIIAPVGGGGLLSGTAIAATALDPQIRV